MLLVKSFFFLALSTFLTVECLATPEASSLSTEVIKCVFDRPLEVGASVTAQLGSVVPVWGPFTALVYGAKNGPYAGSPSSDFISHYREMGLLFAAPQYKVGDKKIENLARWTTQRMSDTGSGQVEGLLTGRNKETFQKSSLIVGVDLFYWDAIWNLCGYGKEATDENLGGQDDKDERRSDTEYQIKRLIQASRDSGKVLMLGNIPHENPDLVKVNSHRNDGGIWWPQTPACVDSINATLAEHCTVANRCYLIDMAGMPNRLKDKYDYYAIRPDGVHLSALGSKILAEEMIQKFESHPPSCR